MHMFVAQLRHISTDESSVDVYVRWAWGALNVYVQREVISSVVKRIQREVILSITHNDTISLVSFITYNTFYNEDTALLDNSRFISISSVFKNSYLHSIMGTFTKTMHDQIQFDCLLSSIITTITMHDNYTMLTVRS
jgi:hypothetical protein